MVMVNLSRLVLVAIVIEPLFILQMVSTGQKSIYHRPCMP